MGMLQLGWYLHAGQVELGSRRTPASPCDCCNVGGAGPIGIGSFLSGFRGTRGEQDDGAIANGLALKLQRSALLQVRRKPLKRLVEHKIQFECGGSPWMYSAERMTGVFHSENSRGLLRP